MTKSVDRNEEEIVGTHGALRDDVDQLQSRARHMVDWRAQMNKHPLAMMGLAVAGGVLAASMLSGLRAATHMSHLRRHDSASERTSRRKSEPRRDATLLDRRSPRSVDGHGTRRAVRIEDRHENGHGVWQSLGAAIAGIVSPAVMRHVQSDMSKPKGSAPRTAAASSARA